MRQTWLLIRRTLLIVVAFGVPAAAGVTKAASKARHLARKMWTLTPKWSPDGRFILFAGSPPPHDEHGLFLPTAGGRKPERISGVAFQFYYSIDWDWSHEGAGIYVLAETGDVTANRGFELSVIPRTGGELHQLTPPELNVYAFDVSRDGQHSDETNLSKNPANDFYPSWIPPQ